MRLGVGPAVTWHARGRDDCGSATVAMLGVLLGVTVALLAAVGAAGAVDAHARARAAADLGALAGAAEARQARALGQPVDAAGCDVATRIAALHGSRVVTCDVSGQAVVTLTVHTADVWAATARSRAGPASASGDKETRGPASANRPPRGSEVW